MLDFSMLVPDLNLDSPSYFAMLEEEQYNQKKELERLLDDFDEYDDDYDALEELYDSQLF